MYQCKHAPTAYVDVHEEQKDFGEWIKLSEKRPEDDQEVWVYIPEFDLVDSDSFSANEYGEEMGVADTNIIDEKGNKTVMPGYHYISNGFYHNGNANVTHWMPIEPIYAPMPPKGEEP